MPSTEGIQEIWQTVYELHQAEQAREAEIKAAAQERKRLGLRKLTTDEERQRKKLNTEYLRLRDRLQRLREEHDLGTPAPFIKRQQFKPTDYDRAVWFDDNEWSPGIHVSLRDIDHEEPRRLIENALFAWPAESEVEEWWDEEGWWIRESNLGPSEWETQVRNWNLRQEAKRTEQQPAPAGN